MYRKPINIDLNTTVVSLSLYTTLVTLTCGRGGGGCILSAYSEAGSLESLPEIHSLRLFVIFFSAWKKRGRNFLHILLFTTYIHFTVASYTTHLCSRVLLEHLILVQMLQPFLSFYHIHKSLHLVTGLNHLNPVNVQTPHSFRINVSITIPAWLGLTNKINLFIAQVSLPEF